MEKLKINNLHVSVDSKMILKGIDLEVNKGEIHALIGPNGQGKSTLLLSIMGHPRYKIEKGFITFKNEKLNNIPVDKRSKMGIFLAMQNPVEISGVSNIDFLKAAINSRREKPINLYNFIKDIENSAKETNFDMELTKRHLNEGFSGGEKKRNELFQLKLLNPSLALIDEIDSGLDVDGLNNVAKTINSLKNDSFSSIVVSHYTKIYELIKPDFVHVIVDGKVVKSGDYSLLEKVNNEGYSWIEKELKLSKGKNK